MRLENERVRRRKLGVPAVVIGLSIAVAAFGKWALTRAEAGVNQVALAASPRAVTAVKAQSSQFRSTRRYVGTLEPWHYAGIGPQLVSGFVATVLVRPGSTVKRGEVLATLDCRNASAASKAVLLESRALEARQRAAAKEAARIQEMLGGGFVSPNEAEQALAQAQATSARIEALRAQVEGKQLEVNDCVMRAPFAGEIAERMVDPGAFAKPGMTMLTLIDREIVRLTADVPEADFATVAPGTPVRIHMLASGATLNAPITRRSPYANRDTRTIHVEIDLVDARGSIPVGTTAVLEVGVGEEERAFELPLTAATVRGDQASLFVVREGRARKLQASVLGERGNALFVRPLEGDLPLVVTQGRGQLADGDSVQAKLEDWP